MKLSDLKIGMQLRLGLGVILAFVVFIGGLAWVQTDLLWQDIKNLYDHPLMVHRAFGELKADILNMSRHMKVIGLAENDFERQAALQAIDTAEANAYRQLEILMDRYMGPQSDVEEVLRAFVQWKAIRTETIRLLREGKTAEAIGQIKGGGAGHAHVDMLLEHVDHVSAFSKARGEEFYLTATRRNENLKMQLGLMVSIIILLSLGVVYLLLKWIKDPLRDLTAVTDQYRQGKFDARSRYASANELGALSASFNRMADTIETELALNGQAAKLAGVMLSEDDARRFCLALLNALIEHTEAQMGAVYLLDDEKTEFAHFESVGLDSAGRKSFSAHLKEGEFGTALATKKMQHITDIPEDTRFTFAAVSGQFTPREIITIPIVAGDETVAVISLAGVRSFGNNSLRLLNTALSTLSARMEGVLAYRKVIAFSEQLEHQNIELEAQKRELAAQADELTEQNAELEMQKEQLDESNRMKTSFLSSMSHELRTPLNSVISLAGVLHRRLTGTIPEEEYGYIEVIERNGTQLLALINDILDLSRIEAGREDIEIKRFSVDELIQEVVQVIGPTAKQKNISLRYLAKDNLPDIGSDYDKCRHILQNLVANAVKFTEEGGVEIAAEASAETVRIAVADTGIGIDEEHLTHIFEEFRQADSSNSRKYGGTGLGLTIAKKYADMLGGSITVKSSRGKGSLFTLGLPVHFSAGDANRETIDDASRRAASKAGRETRKATAGDRTVLVVEDSEAAIIQIRDILETEGYQIMLAHNGGEALERIAKRVPDGMILDLMMPGMDGFEVLKRIRTQENTARLPVIILTAKYITKDELAFLKHNRIQQLIQKGDIDKAKLLEAVGRMLLPAPEEIITPLLKPTSPPAAGSPVLLVVEDNPDNMLAIKALLAGRYKVFEAEDGTSGIEQAKKYLPDLVLMDIAMPSLNGIEVLRAIRKEDTMRHIPVIAVTASAMQGDREEILALGFDGYISKPIDEQILITTIQKALYGNT